MTIAVAGLRRAWSTPGGGLVEAVRGVSFRLGPGAVTGLLGPNGAGKSTTLWVLAGMLAPTAGSVVVAGRDALLDPLGVRRAVGFLPEGAPLPEDHTAGGYLAFVARARGLGPAEAAHAIARTAARVGLEDRLTERIATLSRGYRQRTALAAALVHDPPVVLLDEPTTGLDPHQVDALRGLVRELARGKTVLFSTHALAEVELLCDRVLILHRGELVADDATAAVLARGRGRAVTLALGPSRVEAAAEATLAELRALPGVTAARPLGDGRLEVAADRDVRADLFRWAAGSGRVLIELAEETRSLEDAFLALTATG